MSKDYIKAAEELERALSKAGHWHPMPSDYSDKAVALTLEATVTEFGVASVPEVFVLVKASIAADEAEGNRCCADFRRAWLAAWAKQLGL